MAATKDETRELILAAAKRLFMRYGPVKTSMADIARELSDVAAQPLQFLSLPRRRLGSGRHPGTCSRCNRRSQAPLPRRRVIGRA